MRGGTALCDLHEAREALVGPIAVRFKIDGEFRHRGELLGNSLRVRNGLKAVRVCHAKMEKDHRTCQDGRDDEEE
jgi:hypothetical protein